MECYDIQEKLSAYVEGTISLEEKILIEEHLTICQKCNESLSDLRKTIEYIHNLEEIEPPSWLTQKIMTRVKAEVQPKKSFIQKLFYPLHIKLPIEAVAVILIAVTALYIFKTIQPEMKLAKAPSEEVTPQIPPREIEHPQDKNVPPIDRRGFLTSPPEESKSVPAKPNEQPVPVKEPEIMDKLAEVPKAPAPVVKQEEIRPSAGAAAKDESKTEVLSRASRAKALAERKGEFISLTISVKDTEIACKEIEKAFTQLGGKIIKKESIERKAVITAEIDSKNMNELFEKLKHIGEVKEKEAALEAPEGNVTITIEIVKISMQLH